MLRSARNYDKDLVSLQNTMPDDRERWPSRVVQSHKDECDINVIVKRFGVTGFTQMPAKLPSYGDFSGINDFQTAMNAVRAAQESFMLLPADVRESFGNDPQAFLKFSSDPDNLPALRKMGLAKPLEVKPAEEPPVRTRKKEKGDAGSSGSGNGKPAASSKGAAGDGNAD